MATGDHHEPRVYRLRAVLEKRVGEAQLPD